MCWECLYQRDFFFAVDLFSRLINDDAKIFVMERNEGKEVMFQIEDGTQYYGRIGYVPNSEHYCVVVDRNGTPWEWYVREEAIHFVEEIGTMPCGMVYSPNKL